MFTRVVVCLLLLEAAVGYTLGGEHELFTVVMFDVNRCYPRTCSTLASSARPLALQYLIKSAVSLTERVQGFRKLAREQSRRVGETPTKPQELPVAKAHNTGR